MTHRAVFGRDPQLLGPEFQRRYLPAEYCRFRNALVRPVSSAMQFPETAGNARRAADCLLDSFCRQSPGPVARFSRSPQQALRLMNDNFVLSAVQSTQAGSLLQQSSVSRTAS